GSLVVRAFQVGELANERVPQGFRFPQSLGQLGHEAFRPHQPLFDFGFDSHRFFEVSAGGSPPKTAAGGLRSAEALIIFKKPPEREVKPLRRPPRTIAVFYSPAGVPAICNPHSGSPRATPTSV